MCSCKDKAPAIKCYYKCAILPILYIGLLLVSGSALYSMFFGCKENVGFVFGGFGLVLIIASLIATSSICKYFFEKDEE